MSQRVGAKRRPMTGSVTCGAKPAIYFRISLRSSGLSSLRIALALIRSAGYVRLGGGGKAPSW